MRPEPIHTGTGGPWRLRLICCGFDNGSYTTDTWAQADEAREWYLSGAKDLSKPLSIGHDRAAILEYAQPEQSGGGR